MGVKKFLSNGTLIFPNEEEIIGYIYLSIKFDNHKI